MLVTQTCLQCSRSFSAEKKEVNRGRSVFCGLECFFIHRKANKKEKEHNCVCALCNTTFYRSTSKQANVNGLQFCSRKCSDVAKETERALILRSDANKGSHSYREIARRNQEAACKLCGYSKMPEVLQVHHIDKNRKNNKVENLEILCPTCHAETHFLTR